jgi:hypothetical protein
MDLELDIDGFADCTAILNCAVYALVKNGVVVYVGQSKSVASRLASHCRTRRQRAPKMSGMFNNKTLLGIPFDEIWVRPCMLSEMDKIEMAMIAKHQPRFNTKGKIPNAPIPIEELIRLLPAIDNVPMAAATPRPSVYRRF